MNYLRIVLAAIAGWVALFAYGFLVFGLLISKYYAPYTNVYRSATAVQSYMPIGIACTFIAILVLSIIYAKVYEGRQGVVEGARFGALIGIFTVCAFVADEYVTLNIGRELALAMAIGRLVGFTFVGAVIGSVYKPATAVARQVS